MKNKGDFVVLSLLTSSVCGGKNTPSWGWDESLKNNHSSARRILGTMCLWCFRLLKVKCNSEVIYRLLNYPPSLQPEMLG